VSAPRRGSNTPRSGPEPAAPGRRPPVDPTLRWLALAPVVGYVGFLGYAALLATVLVPAGSPLLFLLPVELLLGVAYAGLVAIDRRNLANAAWSPGRWWYLPAFVLGGTVVAAPVFVAAYFYRRRQRTGTPRRGWLATVRRVVPGF